MELNVPEDVDSTITEIAMPTPNEKSMVDSLYFQLAELFAPLRTHLSGITGHWEALFESILRKNRIGIGLLNLFKHLKESNRFGQQKT